LLRRCLQKDKGRRLRDIGDARIEIEEALAAIPATARASQEATAAAVPSTPPRGMRSRIAQKRTISAGLACIIAALLASLTTLYLRRSSAPASVSVTRFTISLPAGQRLAGPDQPAVALSPDGGLLVYVASAGGAQQLYVRAMDSMDANPVPGTEGAAAPFFSPDGQWVGFFADGKLHKVSIRRGAAVTLSDHSFPGGASWGGQGAIAFAQRINSTLLQVPEGGGPAELLTRPEKGELSHRWPEFLPNGKALLFAASPNPGEWTNPRLVV